MVLLLAIGCTGSTEPPPPTPPAPALAITEVMADNRTAYADPSNPDCPEYDDWIEVTNTTDGDVSLVGFHLSDSSDTFSFPDIVLGAGEQVLVWADGQPEQGTWHAPFGVSRNGETLTLASGSTVVDEVIVPPLGPDQSWARGIGGSSGFSTTDRPTPGEPNVRPLPDHPCFENEGFDDHAYACIPDREGYDWLAGDRANALGVVKFDIFDFQDPTRRRVEFVDSSFFTLHDQYYLWHVLNGQQFPNLDAYPPHAGAFATWNELHEWAEGQDLEAMFDPDMVRFAGDRLYSPYFYREINGPGRVVGVGTLVHREATETHGELWGFELEAADAIDLADLEVYFEVLEANGPAQFDQLVWLIRSEEQEALAQQIEADGHALASRLVRYDELSEPGTVEVYNPGLTAGLVHMVRTGEDGLEASRQDYVLVLDDIPDYLPPARALITNVPQTPLSHVALLARSRGIPNAHLAGVTSDPRWDAWARVHGKVALEIGDHGLRVAGLSNDEYLDWLNLRTQSSPTLEAVDWMALPYTLTLDGTGDPLELRTHAGGKVAGMELLLQTPELDPPDLPMALTVRAFHEHMSALPAPNGSGTADWLVALLDDAPFVRRSDTALRFAVVEGRDAYLERYPSAGDVDRLFLFLAERPAGHLTGDLVRAGGLRAWVESHPLPSAVESAIQQAVVSRYTSLGVDAVRFRSSSTVEDIEGFNGAGLYESRSGYLLPADGQRSVGDAVREVFGSYWGFEAVEERQQARVDHLDGAMGVLVHPRFDDTYERANMVLTLTRTATDIELVVNAQIGAISVANPPTTCPPVLPEVARVTAGGVERISQSTETDLDVLTDAELFALYEQSAAVAERWLALENSVLPAERRRSVLTLDLEARAMDPGWVGSASSRLVMKQARSLDPSTDMLPSELRELPAPEDILARAGAIERRTCGGNGLQVVVDTVTTDPTRPPDMGFTTSPFVFQIAILPLQDLPELGWAANSLVSWNHLDLTDVDLTTDGVSATYLDATLVSDATGWSITNANGTAMGSPLTCVTTVEWAAPGRFLESILDEI